MSVLINLVENLQTNGVFSLYLPFIMTFALFFALLEKSKLLGEDSKQFSMIIALCGAMYVMIFDPIGISAYFAQFFAGSAVAMITIMVFLMIVAMLFGPLSSGDKWKDIWGKALPALVLIGAFIAFSMFYTSGGLDFLGISSGSGVSGSGSFLGDLGISTDDLVLLGLVVGTIVVMLWLVGGGKKSSPKNWVFKPQS